MTPVEDPPPQDPKGGEGLRRFAQTVQMLQSIAVANEKCAVAVNHLANAIAHPKDGMIAACDDVIEALREHAIELRAHRKDLALLRMAINQIPGITLFGKR